MDWVAADWGTTHLRLWRMGADGTASERIENDLGMAALSPDDYEPTLLGLLRDHLPDGRRTPVVICGMAGARQGWCEAPYTAVPAAPPSPAQAVRPTVKDDRLGAWILPGMSQAEPADVMRGEETQIAGVLAARPDFDGVICLPGTHTKWAQISAGEIVSFRTFMTGELFGLLSTASVLRMTVGADGWDDAAFSGAVDRALSSPARVSADLFSLRAEALLRDLDPAAARARLSGLLIGMELSAAKPYWLGQQVCVVGDPGLSARYRDALTDQAVSAEVFDGEEMTLAGLRAAYAALNPVEA